MTILVSKERPGMRGGDSAIPDNILSISDSGHLLTALFVSIVSGAVVLPAVFAADVSTG
jgi:hypothetical protein